MKRDLFYDLLKSVPKAELHVHEEAVLSRETIRTVYDRNFDSKMTDKELNALFKYDDLPGFLTSFLKIQSYFTSIKDFDYMFRDFEDYLEDNNIVYCETFISPTGHLKKGWQFHDIMKAIGRNLNKIKKNSKRTVKVLIDVSRSFGLDNAMNNLSHILEENSPHIIGIGLGGDEAKGPAKDYKAVFDKARKNGLHTVTHAGESCPSYSIFDSINLCHAERIGHGVQSIKDPECVKFLREKEIPLEVCPSSNLLILNEFNRDMKNHPVKKLYDEGVKITLNTDDPTFFKCSLIDEYWNCYKNLGFSLDQIKDIIKNGFRYSFMSPRTKSVWCNKVDKAWDQWFKDHPEA